SWAVTGSGGNQAIAADFAGSVLPSDSVSFAAGEATKTITVSVSADSTVEADESFTITLSAPNGATLGTPAFALGTIRNDDLPVLSIGDARITETDSGTVNAVLVVTLSGPAFVPVTVSYATFDRTATTAGFDYVNTTGTITFAPGETSKTITVSVKGDTSFELDETFGVRLSAPNGATIAKSEGLVAILNDDVRSQIAIAATDARKSEGNTGRTAFTFTVTRTGSLVGDVMLPWKVSGSGARPADRFDFIGGVLPTGTVWFAPGRQTATVTVNVLADSVAEFDEQFTVTLQDPKNGLDFLAVGGGSATGTILNDDGGVPRTFAPATIQAQAFAGSAVATTPSSKTITPQAFAAVGFSTVPAAGVSAKKAQFPAMPRF
ncbi:MAG: Calx-beta domain-containing protein, partial [Planctomycetota bacterium]